LVAAGVGTAAERGIKHAIACHSTAIGQEFTSSAFNFHAWCMGMQLAVASALLADKRTVTLSRCKVPIARLYACRGVHASDFWPKSSAEVQTIQMMKITIKIVSTISQLTSGVILSRDPF
jgi:hypothetical protein